MVRRAFFLCLALLVLAEPAASQQGAGVPVFVNASVDRSQVWVGQPVVWTFQVLRSVDLASAPRYQPPSTPGFVALPLPQAEITSEVGGVLYDGAEVGLVLFPQAGGPVTVGPASVTLSRGAFSLATRLAHPRFFQTLFEDRDTGVLAGASFPIQVRPLPLAGRPPGFTGAVGDFRVSASLEQDEVGVGKAVNLQIVVEGEGNLGLFDPPVLPALPGFRVLETRASGGVDPRAGRPAGQRTFRTVLEALRPGPARIQGLAFAWFDPASGRYRRVGLPALELRVTGSSPLPSGKPRRSADPELPGPRDPGTWRASWPTSGWPLAAQALPLLALALLAIWRPRSPRPARGVHATRQQLEDGTGVAAALDLWLEERLGAGFRRLDRRGLGEALAGQGATPRSLADLACLVDELDARRFAPASAADADCADLAGRLLEVVASVPELQLPPQPSARPGPFPRGLVALSLVLALAAPVALLAGRPRLDAAHHPGVASAAVAWKGGQPDRAAWQYRQALDEGMDCADLWLALGCALGATGDRPRARAAFEAALARAPRDPVIRDRCEATLRALGLADSAARRLLAAGEWLLVASLLAVLAVLAGLLRRRRVLATALVLVAAAGLLFVQGVSGPTRAIVLARSAALHAGPGPDDPEAARLRAGTLVLVGRSQAGWCLVRTAERVEGWVREEQLTWVAGPCRPPRGESARRPL